MKSSVDHLDDSSKLNKESQYVFSIVSTHAHTQRCSQRMIMKLHDVTLLSPRGWVRRASRSGHVASTSLARRRRKWAERDWSLTHARHRRHDVIHLWPRTCDGVHPRRIVRAVGRFTPFSSTFDLENVKRQSTTEASSSTIRVSARRRILTVFRVISGNHHHHHHKSNANKTSNKLYGRCGLRHKMIFMRKNQLSFFFFFASSYDKGLSSLYEWLNLMMANDILPS